MKKFVILDERNVWWKPAIAAAAARGYETARIERDIPPNVPYGPGIGFIRPHADPHILTINQSDYAAMERGGLTMIQDQRQMAAYEDKRLQCQMWSGLMPRTWVFARKNDALEFVENQSVCPDVLVSKADEGASSVNVRILDTKTAQIRHVEQIFTCGIPVNPCADTHTPLVQNDYVLFQEFIPHQITWRVNVVGTKLAAFMRYCYPDKPVAQTGNTQPVMEMTEEVESLFEFARGVFNEIDTRWCAIDVLKDTSGKWKLLETSLAWPWPGVGKQAPFFGTSRHWGEMWEVMFDELEAGVWT